MDPSISEPSLESPHTADAHQGPQRRDIVRAMVAIPAAAAAATVLSACGDDAGGDSSTGQEAPTAPSQPAPGATPAAGVVTSASEVPVGGATVAIVDDVKVVVTQPVAGEFKGFSAVCTHSGCTVVGIEDDAILCRCHGSRFDSSTGAVLTGPAQAPLAPIPVALQGDDVVFA